MLKGGLTGGQQAPHGFHATTGVIGNAIPLAYGVVMLRPMLIWANDWKKSGSPANATLFQVTGGSTKKKGGKKGDTSYYSIAADFVLGHAPILGVLSAYYNNQKFNCPIRSASGTVSSGAMTFTPAGLVAGIVAVTVSEAYSETFNDYGGDGSRTESGTWERPLWNQAFAAPGDINPATAFTSHDPYSFAWNGLDPTITVPTALNGSTVTVYYATPQILKSNGSFYSSTTTPLALLNMEFEFACGSGSEYTKFPAQQIINSFASGLGSVRLDLGAANAIPNLNFECLGAFTCWPNGDCDVADVITDIVTSGPILLGGQLLAG